MLDNEKFRGFKQKMIDQNNEKYGKEVAEKFGAEQLEESNAKLMNITDEQYAAMTLVEERMTETLVEAFKTGNPASNIAQKAANLHKQWLCFSWAKYSQEAHAGLAQMYVDDKRFTAYYDKNGVGTAMFLRDAIHIYTGMNK